MVSFSMQVGVPKGTILLAFSPLRLTNAADPKLRFQAWELGDTSATSLRKEPSKLPCKQYQIWACTRTCITTIAPKSPPVITAHYHPIGALIRNIVFQVLAAVTLGHSCPVDGESGWDPAPTLGAYTVTFLCVVCTECDVTQVPGFTS